MTRRKCCRRTVVLSSVSSRRRVWREGEVDERGRVRGGRGRATSSCHRVWREGGRGG